MLCGALVGKRTELLWNTGRDSVDFYDAKGTVEVLFNSLGVTGYQVIAGEHASLHPGKTAIFTKDGQVLATVGEVHPKVLDDFDINRKVYVFEINVEKLSSQVILLKAYQPLPKFPAINRDLAVVLPVEVSADKVMQGITASAGPLLSDVRLFDVYNGEQVAEGSRSLAFSLTFRHLERTLTDSEIDVFHKNIVEYLGKKLNAKLRS